MVNACGKTARSKPEAAQKVLRGMWLKIAPILEREIQAQGEKMPHDLQWSIVVLESYFQHCGDWQAMEKGLASSKANNNIPQFMIDILVQRLAQKMLEMPGFAP